VWVGWREMVQTYCFGAVVLTLKAMAWLVGLDRRKIWETSWVNGPGYGMSAGEWQAGCLARGREAVGHTLESQLGG
jgi:hypothetical protein